MHKLSQKEVIKRFEDIHGTKYDYSKVVYIDKYHPIEIICPIHNFSFFQLPPTHLSGRGCRMCAGNMKKTTEIFINEGRTKYQDKYDYSQVKYINSETKVKIRCTNHDNWFEQSPSLHINTNKEGCSECVKLKTRSNTINFISQAKSVHGDLYNYDLVDYEKSNIKVKIKCKEHGIFEQRPHDHIINKSGCPTCAVKARSSFTEDFIKKAQEKFGNTYNYSLVNYTNNHTKIQIICPIHKLFYQTPHDHLSSDLPCLTCENERRRLTTEDFVKLARKVHGDKYGYDDTVYITSQEKVAIRCFKHEIFYITPNAHIHGEVGCTICNKYSQSSKIEQKWLNSLNIPKENHQIKIKINKKLFKVDAYDPTTNTVYEFNGDYFHGNPAIYNPENINETTKTTFGELHRRTIEKETILKEAGYTVISIWESDFNDQQNKSKQEK